MTQIQRDTAKEIISEIKEHLNEFDNDTAFKLLGILYHIEDKFNI